jgi:hypothetical protein
MICSATLRTTPVIDPGDFATNYAEVMMMVRTGRLGFKV